MARLPCSQENFRIHLRVKSHTSGAGRDWSVGNEQASGNVKRWAEMASRMGQTVQGGAILLCRHFEGAVPVVDRMPWSEFEEGQQDTSPANRCIENKRADCFHAQTFFNFFF